MKKLKKAFLPSFTLRTKGKKKVSYTWAICVVEEVVAGGEKLFKALLQNIQKKKCADGRNRPLSPVLME